MARKTAGIGADAVQKATGKNWDEWCAFLDKVGGKKKTHKEIVAILGEQHGVDPWWQQMVAVGYEQARGLRVKHETTAGFSVSRSKTLDVPIANAFAAWQDKCIRAKWLADPDITVRKATENRSLRITWIDGHSSVEVMFYPKDKDRCQITVQHAKLKNAKQAAKMKAYWGEHLDKLQALLDRQ